MIQNATAWVTQCKCNVNALKGAAILVLLIHTVFTLGHDIRVWADLLFYNVTALGDQAAGTMTQLASQSYYPNAVLTSPFPLS